MKINKLEDLLGVTRATIRYYEDQGLVTPPRTENGYRDYSDEEVRLFQKIIVLRKLGVSVPEIRDLIGEKPHCMMSWRAMWRDSALSRTKSLLP